jgi:hypothetical protein
MVYYRFRVAPGFQAIEMLNDLGLPVKDVTAEVLGSAAAGEAFDIAYRAAAIKAVWALAAEDIPFAFVPYSAG